jgi:hypothetical protein
MPRAVVLEDDPLSQFRALHHSARLHSAEMIQWLLAWEIHLQLPRSCEQRILSFRFRPPLRLDSITE